MHYGNLMGMRLVRQVIDRWSHLPGDAFKLLVKQAFVCHDSAEHPTAELSVEAMAAALGYEQVTPAARRAVGRATKRLITAGVNTVRQANAPGYRRTYWLDLSPSIAEVQPGDPTQDRSVRTHDRSVPCPSMPLTQEEPSGGSTTADAPAPPHLGVICGGNQMNEPTLFDVNRSSANLSVITGHPGTDITETDRPTNAGHLVAAFIDFCKAHGVTLTGNLIGRYGKLCKRLIGDDIPVDVLKQALAQMLADRVLQWPNRLEQYVMEAQTGPELRRAPLAQTFKQRQEDELMAWAIEQDRLEQLHGRQVGA